MYPVATIFLVSFKNRLNRERFIQVLYSIGSAVGCIECAKRGVCIYTSVIISECTTKTYWIFALTLLVRFCLYCERKLINLRTLICESVNFAYTACFSYDHYMAISAIDYITFGVPMWFIAARVAVVVHLTSHGTMTSK